jgi:hypothetical protein
VAERLELAQDIINTTAVAVAAVHLVAQQQGGDRTHSAASVMRRTVVVVVVHFLHFLLHLLAVQVMVRLPISTCTRTSSKPQKGTLQLCLQVLVSVILELFTIRLSTYLEDMTAPIG